MSRLLLILDVLPRLGIVSVCRLVCYRLLKASGYYAWKYPVEVFENLGDRLLEAGKAIKQVPQSPLQQESARAIADGTFELYGSFSCQFDGLPDWHYNPVLRTRSDSQAHWSRLSLPAGVKHTWELSRFGWAPSLAAAYVETSDEQYLDTLNRLLADWLEQNPLSQGINWHCGQETSIRLINLLFAWYLLGKEGQHLAPVVEAHAARVSQTRVYGLAQNNNHGTSEAVGLFIGGAWLASYGDSPESRQRGQRFASVGRSQLEERVSALVFDDGGFAQYSTNYHRLMLDTLSVAEFWRAELGQPSFSSGFYGSARNATTWLATLTEPTTGAAPNLGGNDGAHLFAWAGVTYENFRPSVHLASSLFTSTGSYDDEQSHRLVQYLLNTDVPVKPLQRRSVVLGDSGLVVLLQGEVTVLIRLPGGKFRPPHADFFHVDVFFRGRNILADSGSYDYDSELHAVLSGTPAHNTVTFDNRDQMPRLSKFLFAKWPALAAGSMTSGNGERVAWAGTWSDYKGATHARAVELAADMLTITDEVSGKFDTAMLRWHLGDDDWQRSGERISSNGITIEIENTPFDVGTSPCSSRYLMRKDRTMLSAPIQEQLKTIIRFDA